MGTYTVYMHTNKANGKRYIGITSQPVANRWKGGNGYRGQKRFYSAIKHYGWNGFVHEILFEGLTKNEAEAKEKEFITWYRSNDSRYGYNVENGGVIHKLSDEQKEHLRQVNKGKTHTEETKAKMSKSHRGLSSVWLKGSKQSDETIAKRFKNAHGSGNHRAMAVYQYDLDGNFIAKYEYMGMVKAILGIKNTSHISLCCNGKRGKAYGYMWSFQFEEKQPYTRLWKGGVIHG